MGCGHDALQIRDRDRALQRSVDLLNSANRSTKKHPRFAYLSPLLKQSKTVAWDYLRAFRYLAMTSDGTVSVRNFSRRLEYPNLGIV